MSWIAIVRNLLRPFVVNPAHGKAVDTYIDAVIAEKRRSDPRDEWSQLQVREECRDEFHDQMLMREIAGMRLTAVLGNVPETTANLMDYLIKTLRYQLL